MADSRPLMPCAVGPARRLRGGEAVLMLMAPAAGLIWFGIAASVHLI